MSTFLLHKINMAPSRHVDETLWPWLESTRVKVFMMCSSIWQKTNDLRTDLDVKVKHLWLDLIWDMMTRMTCVCYVFSLDFLWSFIGLPWFYYSKSDGEGIYFLWEEIIKIFDFCLITFISLNLNNDNQIDNSYFLNRLTDNIIITYLLVPYPLPGQILQVRLQHFKLEEWLVSGLDLP